MNAALLFLACMAVMCVPVAIQYRAFIRAAHRSIPAAPDNQAGSDTTDLWTCRRINALPTATRKEKP